MSVSLAGTDEQLTRLHAEAEYKISDLLCSFQDESIKRVTQLLNESEARAAQLKAERDLAQRDANELRGKLLRACSDADVVNADELCDWIVGAQSELAGNARRIEELEEPLKLKAWYLARTCGDRRSFEEYRNSNVGIRHTEYEGENETPLGIALDGMGDEVEE